MMKTIAFFVCIALIATSCHRKTVSSSADLVSGSETGMASYYAESYNGKRTANGEIYNSSEMTAAHKKLPFGTRVKVTNLSNGKTVKVRINDRGPFVSGRIIDLTRAAARKIDMIGPGVVKVKIKY